MEAGGVLTYIQATHSHTFLKSSFKKGHYKYKNLIIKKKRSPKWERRKGKERLRKGGDQALLCLESIFAAKNCR